MDDLLPIINRIQDIFAALSEHVGNACTLDLPQVVAIGAQSSGKSSVLEALVGRDFLPRGCNLVTRRPLLLQLIQTKRAADALAKKETSGLPGAFNDDPSGDDEADEWGEFGHRDDKFYSFADIHSEIIAETERLLGINTTAISDRPIRLRIYSPRVISLTLVDLPGMTKIPVGEQPWDIEEQIRQMVMAYIKPEAVIILAVTAANADLTNSDALKMAHEVDPSGKTPYSIIDRLTDGRCSNKAGFNGPRDGCR